MRVAHSNWAALRLTSPFMHAYLQDDPLCPLPPDRDSARKASTAEASTAVSWGALAWIHAYEVLQLQYERLGIQANGSSAMHAALVHAQQFVYAP